MHAKKIFKQKIENYLKPIISTYKTDGLNTIVSNMTAAVKENYKPDDIMMYYYFFKFHHQINSNTKSNSNEKNNKDCLERLDNLLFYEFTETSESNPASSKNLYSFLQMYGNNRPDILNKLYLKYINESLSTVGFLRYSRIFMVNNYNYNFQPNETELPLPGKKWENECLRKLKTLLDKEVSSPRLLDNIPRLLRHVNNSLDFPLSEGEYQNYITNINKSVVKRKKNNFNLTSSQTQGKIIKTLKLLEIKFKEEVEVDGYHLDFYLPDLNIALEYNGPDHYYPLQTQLNENTKFRYFQLEKYSKLKVVFINYWEWHRLDNDSVTVNYLKKILFDDYNIVNGPLFYENFDTLKTLRIKN